MSDPYYIHEGEGPFVAASLHSGHEVRDELKPLLNLTEMERFREEDPYTDLLTDIAPARIIGLRSRFEVDLNRERSLAVYRSPENAWGLDVWKSPPGDEIVSRSLEIYDAFYADVKEFLSSIISRYGYVVIYDLHSYNHRRDGPGAPPADPEKNPDVNLGTSNMNRDLWAPVVEGLAEDLRFFEFPGGRLDVRENVKFFGGDFSRWVNKTFGNRSCTIAIEFKKIFMDEWSDQYDRELLSAIREALEKSVPGMLRRSREVAAAFSEVPK
jgi:N-formylglutamate deformylase